MLAMKRAIALVAAALTAAACHSGTWEPPRDAGPAPMDADVDAARWVQCTDCPLPRCSPDGLVWCERRGGKTPRPGACDGCVPLCGLLAEPEPLEPLECASAPDVLRCHEGARQVVYCFRLEP